jgi:hypothetical protein
MTYVVASSAGRPGAPHGDILTEIRDGLRIYGRRDKRCPNRTRRNGIGADAFSGMVAWNVGVKAAEAD